MYIATIKKLDVANGPGLRTSVFVSGCTHYCKNCFNRVAWDFKYGKEYTTETENEIIDSLKDEYVHGMTLLGGEPMEFVNQRGLVSLVKRVHETFPDKSIWCFTGYLFEELLEGGKMHCEVTDELLSCLEVIVDGEFIEAQKSLMLKYKGSANQRTIDVQESLKQKKVVLYDLERC